MLAWLRVAALALALAAVVAASPALAQFSPPAGGGGGGDSVGPLPFFGSTPGTWSRPALSTFSTWLNQGGECVSVGSDSPFFEDGVPIAAGDSYAVNDTITLAGGTLSPGGVRTVLTVDSISGGGGAGPITSAHISTVGQYSAPPTIPISQLASSSIGTGATWGAIFATNLAATDNPSGLPLVLQSDGSASNAGLHQDLAGLLKAAPPAPYTITVALAAVALRPGGNSAWFIPIILFNSAQDKAIAVVWYVNSGAASVTVYHYDGTISAVNTGSPIEASSNGPPSTRAGFAFPDYFAWFRVHNDGTLITLSVSSEGVLFWPFYTESAAGFAPSYDKVGFGMERALAASNVNALFASILWSWVEISP